MPAALNAAVRSPGVRLPHRSDVVVHTGTEAALAAGGLGADAVTIGRHIVFGDGQYRPSTTDGRSLLSHELAHVDDQRNRGVITLDRQTKKDDSPYAALTDTIADAHARPSFYSNMKLVTLEALQKLAQAVEAKDKAAVTAATAAFLKADSPNADPKSIVDTSLDPSTGERLKGVPMTLVSRIFLLGLRKEAIDLERHFFFEPSHSNYDQPASDNSGYSKLFYVRRAVAQQAIANASYTDPAAADRSILQVKIAFDLINTSLIDLDMAVVEKDLERSKLQAGSGPALTTSTTDIAITEGQYYALLVNLTGPLGEVMDRAFQVLIEDARTKLETKVDGTATDALSHAKTALQSTIIPTITQFDQIVKARIKLVELALHVLAWLIKLFGGNVQINDEAVAKALAGEMRPVEGAQVETTRSDFSGKEKRHLDAFDTSKNSPSVVIQAFDDKATTFFERSLSLAKIFEIRQRQVTTLEVLFGQQTGQDGKVTKSSQENLMAIQSMPEFHLHDDDSWRTFLLAKLNARLADNPDKWKALVDVTDVLKLYLRAYTMHTPYNIDEFGDNYLTRTFPKDLTGRLIHDCGVYALRIAYGLSLVREKLGLRFRAVLMPVHVGLVITFDDTASSGALYANNEDILPVDGMRLTQLAKQWAATDEKGVARTPVAVDMDKVHAEVAASTFAERVDVPTRLVDIPAQPASKSNAENKKALWDFYHKSMLTPAATGRTAAVPQPELAYLAFMQKEKDTQNNLRVPAYRKAFELWKRDERKVRQAGVDFFSPDKARRDSALTVLKQHQADLKVIFDPLKARLEDLQAEANRISAEMASTPGLIGQGSELRHANRLKLHHDGEVETYVYGDVAPDPNGGPMKIITEATIVAPTTSEAVVPSTWSNEKALPGPAE